MVRGCCTVSKIDGISVEDICGFGRSRLWTIEMQVMEEDGHHSHMSPHSTGRA